jgi:AcrR family transcriptional regulator
MPHIKTDPRDLTARGIAPDGRARRALATRGKIIAAMSDLVGEGNVSPTSEQIGRRAGVSTRSIFMHFDDIGALFVAVLDHLIREAMPRLPPIPKGAPFADRLGFYVDNRVRLAEEFGSYWRSATILFPTHQEIQQRVNAVRAAVRSRTRATFEIELNRLEPAAANDVLDTIVAATTWEVWRTLREAQGRTREQARSVFETIVVGTMLAYDVTISTGGIRLVETTPPAAAED